MKIWYQTNTAYRYDPVFDTYGHNLEKKCAQAARPGTEIYVTGVPVAAAERDLYKSVTYYHSAQSLNNMLRAEAEGYDAFIMGCSYDTSVTEGRELLSIPVIGLGQSCFLMASMLGDRFSILTCGSHIVKKYDQMIRQYGLEANYLRGPYVSEISIGELQKKLKDDPVNTAQSFIAPAKRAVKDGASVLIPVPAYICQILESAGYSGSIDGATILDPVVVALKYAEMLVDLKKLGIDFSRSHQVYGHPDLEKRKEILELYKDAFRIDIPETWK